MLHFFPTFSRDAAESPVGDALRQSGAPHRIFAGEVRFNYRSGAQLICVCIPRLARPAPRAVILCANIEVLIFAVLRLVSRRWSTRIVLNGFIYTQRTSPFVNSVRRRRPRPVLRRLDPADPRHPSPPARLPRPSPRPSILRPRRQ